MTAYPPQPGAPGHKKTRTWRASWLVGGLITSGQALVFAFAGALLGVATCAHGLKRTAPKITALGDGRDVVDHGGDASALDAYRVQLQPREPELAPHLRTVPLITVHSFAWLALVRPWAAPAAFVNPCHLSAVLLEIFDMRLVALWRCRML